MALRAFRFSGLVAIDDEEAVEEEVREKSAGPVTIDELQGWLTEVAEVELNRENQSSDVGFASIELKWGTLKELPVAEVAELYGLPKTETKTKKPFEETISTTHPVGLRLVKVELTTAEAAKLAGRMLEVGCYAEWDPLPFDNWELRFKPEFLPAVEAIFFKDIRPRA